MRLPSSGRSQPEAALLQPVSLKASYLNRRSFLAQSRVGSERCTLEVSATPELAVGTPVQLRVEFQDQVMVFHLEGSVARSSGGQAQIEFSGAALHGFGRIHAFARGAPIVWGRGAHERIEVAFPIHVYSPEGQLARGEVEDASRGGLRVRLSFLRLRAGQSVRFASRLGLLRRIRGLARIAWATADRGQVLAGLEFQEMDVADRLTLGAYLLERRGQP